MASRDSYTLAQQSVIGSMLIDDRCVPLVISNLKEDDFLDPICRNFFRAIRELAREGKPIDPVTVTGKLKAEGEYVQWCAEVMEITPTAANVGAYISMCRHRPELGTKRVPGNRDRSENRKSVCPCQSRAFQKSKNRYYGR